MLRSITRLVALLAIMVGFSLIGTGATAIANGDGHGKNDRSDHRSSSHKRSGGKHKSDRRDWSDRDRNKGDRDNDKGDRDESGHSGKCFDRDESGDDDDNGGGQCDKGTYSAWDEQWLTMAIEGDLFEIAGGNLALQKAQNPETRDLANTLIADHTKSLEEAVNTAKDLGIEVPEDPSPTQQWQLRVLRSLPNSEFDRWYSDLEIQDHRQDIKEAQDEVEDGCNAQIRGLAAEEIPVLQHHLELAQRAFEVSGGDQASSSAKKYRKHLRRHARHHHRAHH